ncbi:beta-Ig-H3/fasciclin [Nostoc sp. UHCC 0252]|nr:beta-Ig-H3/fasciclin [Nostoc sp. UHCC 0252]MEA5605930.1 beta-Ig-H3/fasciclin [Nostoc sp. UHCC 0252]
MMNKKFIFLVSAFGLSVLIGACQPGTESPTTAPAAPSPVVPSVTPASP